MPEAIGGYFELALNDGKPYHEGLIGLNSGRNAFEYILKSKKYRHVWIPFYACAALLEPLNRLAITYDFYEVNDALEPVALPLFKEGDAFLYINYFGLKSEYVKKLAALRPGLIVDAAQAFFEMPLAGVDTFYSPRKFFGVPDGGYVSCDAVLNDELDQDYSAGRIEHLVKRIDYTASDGYPNYQANETAFSKIPLLHMSSLTSRLLNNIDYQVCLNKRNQNFIFLHRYLGSKNLFRWITNTGLNGPLIYPLYLEDKKMRSKLLSQKIYTAKYWSPEEPPVQLNNSAKTLAQNILALPVDHRYSEKEMDKIIQVING